MSADVVIRAEDLGKKYLIGHQDAPERYQSLRDVMARGARNLARSARDLALGRQLVGGDTVEEFWALRELDFEIKRGEVVGIIGRNGAGKSTLLKILSRITEPSEGRVEIRGRVASLLEVGTGFHPELSGRENIFLNGAILGMSRAEIRRKFDEIVAFAEIERFLDTPVKRYSSGMYVRLAFAVAAHLEPEILVVDEVLAVGDTAFQKKCLGKMQDVAGHGRTVLFVSHQLGSVAKLCTRGIVLSKGMVAFNGAASAAIDAYAAQGATTNRADLANRRLASGSPYRLLSVEVLDRDGGAAGEFTWDQPIRVRVRAEADHGPGGALLGVAIEDFKATRVTTWVAPLADHLGREAGAVEYDLEIAPRFIAPGAYTFTIAIFEPGHVYDIVEGALPIAILDSGSEMAAFGDVDYGVAIIPARWTAASLQHSSETT